MIKHIVIWSLKDEAEGCKKAENVAKFKSMLEDLVGKIDVIVSLEVGIKTDEAPANNDDIILVSEFNTWNDLSTYANHPDHVKVVEFAQKVVEKRSAVDYVC